MKSYHSVSFIRRLYQQAKQISQIIAYIWRWDDEERPENAEQKNTANELKVYFTKPTTGNEVGDNLKKLFRASPQCPGKEWDLLKAVFGPNINEQYIFPIFDKFELGEINTKLGYLFHININSFNGVIKDPTLNNPCLLMFEIPYPPRPLIGNTTVTKEDLEDWIANREEDTYFSENPYIPATCS
ncbi:MAG: hypothetical protein F6K40_08995 [Okeania sp. SIO3I5]|nr:hypothetical protein [Okeania sp. SIO3I5]